MGNLGSAAVAKRPVDVSELPGGPRRALGLVALSLAFAILLGAPALLSDGITGHPMAAPLPMPPAVGSCVTLPADPNFSGAGEQGFQVVACDQPHDAEVSMTWPAGTPPQSQVGGTGQLPGEFILPFNAEFPVLSDMGSGTVSSPHFVCADWNLSFIGPPAPLAGSSWWTVWPTFASGMITAPAVDRAGVLGWSACIVEPATVPTRYAGTIRSAPTMPDQHRPEQYFSCLSRSQYGRTELIYSSCAQPHRVEPIALQSGLEPAAPADRALVGCLEVVQRLTGAADPSYGGRLAVKVENVGLRTLTLEQMTELPAGATAAGACVVELVGSGSLVGSVIGLGDRPLPVF